MVSEYILEDILFEDSDGCIMFQVGKGDSVYFYIGDINEENS
jgi:hypothetical protein